MTRTLLTLSFSALALTACKQPIEVGLPPPPAEWMVCDALPAKPDLKPLERITLPDGRVVYLASETNARDAEIARYVVGVRGAWFSCSNQLEKVRGYYAE